jgi:hypothetical protein
VSGVGIRTGDAVGVTLVSGFDGSYVEHFEATFQGIDTGRDGVTVEAIIVSRGSNEFRYPLGEVLIEPSREAVGA